MTFLVFLSSTVRPQASITVDTLSNSSILELADEAYGWKAGDRVVVASTDYSMHQAEEFDVLPCPACAPNQVKVQGQSVQSVTLSPASHRAAYQSASSGRHGLLVPCRGLCGKVLKRMCICTAKHVLFRCAFNPGSEFACVSVSETECSSHVPGSGVSGLPAAVHAGTEPG